MIPHQRPLITSCTAYLLAKILHSLKESKTIKHLKGYNPNLFPMSIMNRHPSRLYRHSVGKSTPLARDGVRFNNLSFEKYHLTIAAMIILTQREFKVAILSKNHENYRVPSSQKYITWQPSLVTRPYSVFRVKLTSMA